MKISPSLTALINPDRRDAATLLRRLQPGQELQARVLDVPRPGIARLQIGLTELLAHTRAAVEPGTRLRLGVARLYPKPELRILQEAPPAPPAERVLRAALSRQIPLGEALHKLSQVWSAPGNRLPPEIRRVGTDLLQRFPVPQDLTAARLRELFLGSGLFLEPALAQTGLPPLGDQKLVLLKLLRLLQGNREPLGAGGGASSPAGADPGASPEHEILLPQGLIERLIHLAQGALARVQTQQAAALPGTVNDRPGWLFELPVLVAGQPQEILIRIDHQAAKDGRQAGQPDTPWTVTLGFELGASGRVQAQITVEGSRVSSMFWCERTETRRRFDAGLPRLEGALRGVGLEVGRLCTVQGTPPAPLEVAKPAPGLLDTHA